MAHNQALPALPWHAHSFLPNPFEPDPSQEEPGEHLCGSLSAPDVPRASTVSVPSLASLADTALARALDSAASERALSARYSRARLPHAHARLLGPCARVLDCLHRQDISLHAKAAAIRFAGLVYSATPPDWAHSLPESVTSAFKVAHMGHHNPLGSGLVFNARELSALFRESAEHQRERLNQSLTELEHDRQRLGSTSNAVSMREKALNGVQLQVQRLERFAEVADQACFDSTISVAH